MPNQSQFTETDPDRLLWGACEIAAHICRTERQAFYLLENGLIPAAKVGKSWVTTPRRLREHLLGNVAA